MSTQILAPAAALVVWTLVVMMWMMMTRLSALGKSGIDLKQSKPGGRGEQLNGVLPDNVMWKSHNYTHLLEQPTLFYAVVVILAVSGAGTGINLQLAWAYVVLRVIHSLWQATVNTIMPVRFGLFFLSTLCLIVLAINALRATL